MNLQYIWGNPARKKRKKSKKKSSKKVRRKKASSKKKTRRKTRRKKSASKKKSSKRRKKVARRKKKKNPYKTRYRKKGAVGSKGGSKYKYSATQLLPSERQSLKSKHSSLQNSIAKLERELERGKKAGVTVSSTVKARLSKAKNMSKLLNKKLRTDQVTALKNKKLKAELQKLGFEYDGIVKEAAKSTGGKSMARRKKAKKKATKKKGRKKATRKKATRRKARKKGKKKATRKKARKKGKKKAAKKAGRRRRRRKSSVSASVNVGKSTISGKIRGRKRLKKGQSLRKTVRKKRRKYSIGIRRTNPLFRSNPVEVMGYKATGYDLAEVGELAVGGLTYGAINGFLASKVASKVPGGAKLASMLGGTALPLVAGVLAHAMADKFMPGGKAKQALLFMADGLTAASVVGMGVHLSQGLLSQVGLSGVDYVPAMPGAQQDFGGVDFTPELGGVDFTAGASLPGHNQDVDFGEYEESAADFGVVPEGLN